MTDAQLLELLKIPPKAWNNRVLSYLQAPVDAGFNERWRQFPKPQATTAGILTLKTGFQPNDLAGKTVLDGGCGCGRFSAVAETWGADVLGVDGSPAGLDAARTNTTNARFLHANLLDLPIRDKALDAAFSVGVLHHTADPEASFREVVRTVRPGGQIAIWVYARTWEERLQPAMDLMHALTKACPPAKLREIFEQYAIPVRDLYNKRWDELQQVLRISNSEDNNECVSDSLDWHTPQYRFWHTTDEIKGWFTRANCSVDWIGDFPVSMRGTKQ